MATHSSILARRIPQREEPVGYSSWGCKELDTTEQLTLSDLHFLKESVQFPLRSLHSLTEMSSCFGQKLHQLSLIIAINSG